MQAKFEIPDLEGWNASTYDISDEEEELEKSPYTMGYSQNYLESLKSLNLSDIQ